MSELPGFNPAAYDEEPDETALGVVRWWNIDDRDDIDITAVWGALVEFVDWLIDRYTLPRGLIPDCWYRHGALVEELSALHSGYLAAFDDADSGYGPIGFQERLAQARGRFRESYAGTCDTGHVDPPERRRRDLSNDLSEWVMEAHSPI